MWKYLIKVRVNISKRHDIRIKRIVSTISIMIPITIFRLHLNVHIPTCILNNN